MSLLFTLALSVDTRPYPQSGGSYATKGTLTQADELKAETQDHVIIFPTRNRGYGSLDLISLVENVAAQIRKEVPGIERLQVGDLSQAAGGKISGHDSHQNGLDVDLVYFRKSRKEADPKTATKFDESFVSGQTVTANFDMDANWALISLLVSSGRVERIFVDPVIKKAFCDHADTLKIRKESEEILRALRPWPHHDDHLHVRLSCPAASTGCVKQVAPPPGDGCVQWWAFDILTE